jgi:hypothetical protein
VTKYLITAGVVVLVAAFAKRSDKLGALAAVGYLMLRRYDSWLML